MIRALLSDVVEAAVLTLSPPLRIVLWKSLALSLLLLGLAWAGVERLAAAASAAEPLWVRAPLEILAGAAFVIFAAYLLAPICAILTGFFADDVSETVEREANPALVGRRLPFRVALMAGLRLFVLALAVNALALLLLLVPIVNAVAFLGANAYLLGRASFEFAALRHGPPGEAHELLERHSAYVFLCGLVVALLLAVPVVNLGATLFSIVLMTRAYLRASGKLPTEVARR